MRALGLALALLVAGCTPAAAQTADPSLTRVTIETATVQAVALALKKLEPTACRWCSGPAWDTPASWVDTKKADALSYATLGTESALVALMPLLERNDDAATKMQRSLQLARALAWTGLVSEGIKIFAARERPDGSDALSFLSQHSAYAGTEFGQLWKHGHQKTALFVALPAAIATAWLRTSAGKHHPLDVIAGLAAGATIGFVLP